MRAIFRREHVGQKVPQLAEPANLTAIGAAVVRQSPPPVRQRENMAVPSYRRLHDPLGYAFGEHRLKRRHATLETILRKRIVGRGPDAGAGCQDPAIGGIRNAGGSRVVMDQKLLTMRDHDATAFSISSAMMARETL